MNCNRAPVQWAAIIAAGLLLLPCIARSSDDAASVSSNTPPAFWFWAPTPPMGWNSYDTYGDSVTEEETLANARYLKKHLLSHGWKYVVIDFRWYDPVATPDDKNLTRDRSGARLTADLFGRLLPAVNKFPSAATGQGFKPLADKIHDMGLQFGIHIMRGIPRQAVNTSTPIAGTGLTAADAGDPHSICEWCPDMYGVRDNPAGQAWYDSIFGLYSSWGVDFVKVDDLSSPYHTNEIEMIRKAIDHCGRPIVFSTSPGPTAVSHAAHIEQQANMWRISGDFWDQWRKLNEQFELLSHWQDGGGPGHWPDADMIPFGHLSIRSWANARERQTRFTKDEMVTLMSLWSLAPSPLMLGMNLPDTDAWTLDLLSNDEVIAVDQDPLGNPARRVMQRDNTEAWVKKLHDGSSAVGLFNRGQTNAIVELRWGEAGLAGRQIIRDLWTHETLGAFEGKFSSYVPAHGAALFRAAPPPPSGPTTHLFPGRQLQ
jgi:alpha-galactosidase